MSTIALPRARPHGRAHGRQPGQGRLPVTGFDVVPAALDSRAGSTASPLPGRRAEAVAGAAVVLTMLPSGKHVLDAYRGAGGRPACSRRAAPGTLFIDCSTIDVDEAREAAQLAVAAGHRAVDAPVSGGVVGAEAGTLTFMVGGTDGGLRGGRSRCSTSMGQRVVHCGGHGAGPGGEDLQQHDPRRLDDRRQRGLRARREARPDPPGAVRRRLRTPRASAGR